MLSLGAIGFTTPWLLLALLALPILWIILRAVPPAPVRRLFPGVILLLGLRDDEQVSDRTPWWLLLLRMLAVAAAILGLAGPILNPDQDQQAGNGPLLILMDGSWASAADWASRQSSVEAELQEAARNNRPVALGLLTAPETPLFQSADVVQQSVAGLEPRAWSATPDDIQRFTAELGDARFETVWLSDGLDRDGRADLLATLEDRGPVRVIESPRTPHGLRPARIEDGDIVLAAHRRDAGPATELSIVAHGRDPAGNAAVLARVPIRFASGETDAETALSLPAELRARVTRFELEGQRTAGAVTLPDDSLRRREIAMIAGRDDREGLELLSPLHYLNKALEPNADLLTGGIPDVLPANPDVIILADVATITGAEQIALTEWIEKGGLLLRFAGPRLAASDVSRAQEDPLMPVRLRAGGRTVGGAMSWGAPKSLAPFDQSSPFFGLPVPDDVRITSQVMAQPDPTLADRVIAQLSDGTPLVTRKSIGAGQVVLMHVTANAEWSNLPLSGLFVQMLERLAVSTAVGTPEAQDLAGTIWQPVQILDAFGTLRDAGTLAGVSGEALIDAPLGPDLRPGIYSGDDRSLARNVISPKSTLTKFNWPDRISVSGLTKPEEQPLAGFLLALALLLLVADVIASLALSGRLIGPRGATVAAVLAILVSGTPQANAQDAFALDATGEVTLAYVRTGNAQLDDMSNAGLRGLSETLFFRTSVEPADPIGVDLERDELAFFPFIYWPITPDQPTPSVEAYAKLNTYLRSGGMILFDTRDSDIARFGAASPNGRKLQQLARPLDIPALEQIPSDHVLTRTFYLLQDFPGRHNVRDVWVEAAPPDAEQIEGMPFRNLNDGVTPVVIGGNDWAAAWAKDSGGNAMFPVGRGFAGERQRELSFRFGVNLIMHVLTGNYKSDQVHVPALLDRLGQ